MTPRQFFAWKFWFYDVALPLFQRLGPRGCDALIGGLGRLCACFRPKLRQRAIAALTRANVALDASWNIDREATAVLSNFPRYLARDYPIDNTNAANTLARFTTWGEDHLTEALAEGRGVVLVGSHFGAHVAGIHWLHRREIPLRLLVQRPKHMSNFLSKSIDVPTDQPQAKFFLRRGLSTGEAADRILRAHGALRTGMAVYFNGDIPWIGPNARPGHLLGLARPFLSVWADLAVLARAPVIFVTCVHAPGGRFELEFTVPLQLSPGDEAKAVAGYLSHLETAIRARPSEAVAHLTWPSFAPGELVMPCKRTHHLTNENVDQAPRSPGGLAPQPSLLRSVR